MNSEDCATVRWLQWYEANKEAFWQSEVQRHTNAIEGREPTEQEVEWLIESQNQLTLVRKIK